ncbi:MAG: DUF4388 domain-containing protein, partial [Actinomycetota bacterium]|nr:DUF4388 domain-containing protein [Actinomycetota bacterium]
MLEGTLDSFSLPDIFQLLALTKKSGRLDLKSDRGQGKVWFRDGQVYYALASGGRLALGKRLAAAGRVTAEQVQQALEQQRELGGPRLGTILVDQGAIDDATLETFVREQIQDAVFDLMRWSDGQFAFESALDLDEPIGLTVTVENLIMEGSRRLEEWDAVRKKIPGLEAVVAMAPAPDDAGVEVNLKPEEWRLLTMVDGRRTVGDLVELSGKGEFAVCKLLYGMVGAGVLEVRDVDVQGPSSVAAILDEVELIRQLEEGEPVSEPAPQRRPAAAPRAPDEPP